MEQNTLQHTDVEVKDFDDSGWVSLEEWCNHAPKFSSSFLFLANGRADFSKFCICVDDNKKLVIEPKTGILARFRFPFTDWRMKSILVED